MFIGSVIQSVAFEQSLFKKGLPAGGWGLAVGIEMGTGKTIGTAVPH